MPSQGASVHQALRGLASFIAENQASKRYRVILRMVIGETSS